MIMQVKVHGLRLFLYALLQLIKDGKRESCAFVESKLSAGIASALREKYPTVFSESLSSDIINEIDQYYKKWSGCSDGEENKYACEVQDGLYLLIKLALNEIYQEIQDLSPSFKLGEEE